MTPEDRRDAAAVDHYWDSLALTGAPSATGDLDGESAAQIDLLWTLSAPPTAEAARQRVWQRVQAQSMEKPTGDGLSATTLDASMSELWSANGRGTPLPRPGHDRPWSRKAAGGRATATGAPELPAFGVSASSSRNGWSDHALWPSAPSHAGGQGRRLLGPFATAALVLLTLLGSFVAILGSRPLWTPDEPLARISIIDNPVETDTLMDAFVTEWPDADPLLWASLRRQIFDPGAVEEFGVTSSVGDGLDLFIVQSGQLTVEADGPMVLWRGPVDQGAEPTSLPAGSRIVLSAGDRLYVPAGAPFRRRNDTAAPAVILGFQITQREALLHPVGVTNVRLMPDKVLNRALSAPAEMAVRRLQLLPGQRLLIHDLPGLQMVYVEEGTLDLMGARRLGDLAPVSWTSIPAGQGMAHFETTTDLANGSTSSVTVLVATTAPAVSDES